MLTPVGLFGPSRACNSPGSSSSSTGRRLPEPPPHSVFEAFIYAERTAGPAGTREDRARLLSATVERRSPGPASPDAALLSGLA